MLSLKESQKFKQGDDLGTKMMRSVLDTECVGTTGYYVGYSSFAPGFIPIAFADPTDGFTHPPLASGFNQWEAPVRDQGVEIGQVWYFFPCSFTA